MVPALATVDAPEGVTLTALPERRHTRIACRRGAERHPAIAAFATTIRAAAAELP